MWFISAIDERNASFHGRPFMFTFMFMKRSSPFWMPAFIEGPPTKSNGRAITCSDQIRREKTMDDTLGLPAPLVYTFGITQQKQFE
jgi:hypothetical protein